MLKWTARIFGGLLNLVVLLVAVEKIAAESAEVVVLHARDAAGELVTTRLWVVDHEGRQYLRVGADGAGWYSRITDDPEVAVARGGDPMPYLAVPQPTLSDAVNGLMYAKYGWRDSVIGAMVGGREGSIPIRLDPR